MGYAGHVGATYGEQVLRQAERRARAVSARRRGLTLLMPGAVAALWALADLVAARHARLVSLDVSVLRHVVDHAEPILWTVLFSFLPLLASVKPEPLPSGAALALAAGPVLSPTLFGSGGWKPWQIAVVAAIAVLVLGAALQRALDRRR